jgi:hypothetical protein
MEGQDIRGLIEAYSQVYETPEVLNEEVVEEDIEVLDEMGRPGGNLPGAKSKAQIAAAAERRMQANVQRTQAPTLPTTRSRGDASKYQAVARDKAAGGDAAYRAGGGDAAARGGLTRQQIQQKGMAATKAAPTKPAAGGGSTPPVKPAAGGGSTPPVKPASGAGAPKPAATSTPKPAATPAKPAPGTKAAGPESIKPKTPNPLMQKTFGYQTGNAPDQIAKASAGKPTPSGSALGSAADPKVRAALNLPSKPAASLSQAPAPKPAEAPKPQMSAKAQALKTGGPAGGARERMLNQDLDIFDLVKGHLLDEGYADSEEGAMVIMVNMSEEWRQSILESYGVQLDEISKELALKAHAERGTREFESDGDNPQDFTKSGKSKADESERRIVKKHGEGARREANRAAEKRIYGHNKYSEAQERENEKKKKAKNEGYAVTIEDIVKLLDENREHDREMRKAAARERAEEKKERKEEGKKSAKAPGRLGKSAGSSYADYQELSIKSHDKMTKGKYIPGMVKNEEVELVDESALGTMAVLGGMAAGRAIHGKLQKRKAKKELETKTKTSDYFIMKDKTKKAVARDRAASDDTRKEDLEAWVDELIAEGYDLSGYTWEEVAEIYAQELELSEAQRARENPEGHDKEEKRKYEPVRGERTPMPPRGDKRREEFEKWYAKQMGR